MIVPVLKPSQFPIQRVLSALLLDVEQAGLKAKHSLPSNAEGMGGIRPTLLHKPSGGVQDQFEITNFILHSSDTLLV
jgi:hypothetical protein